ncbi:hypothetical protein SprV_0401581100 [Sparganum proliferum]
MGRQLNDGIMARIPNKGTVSEAFAVTNRVKQGCVLASALFSLTFSTMLMDAYGDECSRIRIAYGNDGHFLNTLRMQASTRLTTTIVDDLLFADDCALKTVSEADIQRSMELFVPSCADSVPTINTDKTVVIHQSSPGAAHSVPRIHVNGIQLKTVDSFAYLDSTLPTAK